MLNAFGLPLVASAVAHTADDAAALAAVLGFPVVAKVLSHRVPHKTEIGGVRLNLQNEEAVRAAFDDILARAKAARADRYVLAGGHRHRTRHQASDAGDQYLAAPGTRGRHADDEAGGGDDAVVRPQHRGAQPANARGAVSLRMNTSRHDSQFTSSALLVERTPCRSLRG